MDPFFGWTAAVLATYLAGCDLIENDTSANDRSDVPSKDVLVRRIVPPDNASITNRASTGA